MYLERKTSMPDYDFAGWVTKNDVLCSDGVTIRHGAFQENDDQVVPLVWNHDHNSPDNVVGQVRLENLEHGVYGYATFNDTESGRNSKTLVSDGTISHMSIAANKVKRSGDDVVHGNIYEVSLVLAAANPGALIETVMQHSDGEGDEIIYYSQFLIHSAEDIPEEEKGDQKMAEQTIGEVLDTLNPEQMTAVQALIGHVMEDQGSEDEEVEQSATKKPEDDEDEDEDKKKKDGNSMKHNAFDQNGQQGSLLSHADLRDMIQTAAAGKLSLKEVIAEKAQSIMHSQGAEGADQLLHVDHKYGITNIEKLFPEAHQITDRPTWIRNVDTAYEEILNGTTKSPFSRIKTATADLTTEDARARGYIKATEKIEQFFEVMSRTTTPQTIYKKQKLDRDDIIDITDFDVVSWINEEMKFMLKEEIARAVLIGDGRKVSDPSKIQASNIRPIVSDDPFYTVQKTSAGAESFLEDVIKGMVDYRGSGAPTMFINKNLLVDVKLLKGSDGRFLFNDIPTNEAMAARFGVAKIVETSFITDKKAIIVNLRDYTIGSTKGGEITNFDDFDIDFNQYKYLIETRLSGALTLPKSALVFTVGTDSKKA